MVEVAVINAMEKENLPLHINRAWYTSEGAERYHKRLKGEDNG
jgi:hypothetical protein